MSKTKKVFGVLLTLLALSAVLAGFKLSTIVRGTQVSTGDWLNIVRDPRGYFPADKERLNVLLIGKDYNHVNHKGVNHGILYTKGARSDTLILLSLDLKNGTVSALSIPRDTYIEYPPGLPGRRDKINAAYAWGGAKLAMDTVGRLLGVAPDHYIALKPDAVKTIVDELGGVEVEALDRMKYDDNWGNLHIDLPAGRQSINGDQAIQFTRFRKSNAGEPRSKEEGDERRMARQQQLLRAMLAKAKQPQVFMRGNELINAGLGAIETDLSRPQLFALAALFKEVRPEQMQTASLPATDVKRGGRWYLMPDERKTEAMVAWLIKGDESAANRLTTVAVKNATRVRGAARGAAALLQREGFDAAPARGGTPAEQSQTQILYGTAAVATRASRIAALLGGGAVNKAFSPEQKAELGAADVSVVLGRDLAPTFAASRQEARLR